MKKKHEQGNLNVHWKFQLLVQEYQRAKSANHKAKELLNLTEQRLHPWLQTKRSIHIYAS
jgi:hypothetical protein